MATKILIMGLPGSGEETFDEIITKISATNIRKDLKNKGII